MAELKLGPPKGKNSTFGKFVPERATTCLDSHTSPYSDAATNAAFRL